MAALLPYRNDTYLPTKVRAATSGRILVVSRLSRPEGCGWRGGLVAFKGPTCRGPWAAATATMTAPPAEARRRLDAFASSRGASIWRVAHFAK